MSAWGGNIHTEKSSTHLIFQCLQFDIHKRYLLYQIAEYLVICCLLIPKRSLLLLFPHVKRTTFHILDEECGRELN